MMKKLLLILLVANLMPYALVAQSVDDDLYYVPSKKKEAKVDIKAPVKETTVVVQTETPVKVVVRDKKKQVRDIDEYNRRYDSSDYEFSADNDTLYIDEREVSDLEGEWVNGFDGTEDDYEYAVRLIRFRNPLYAVSVGSPFYWNIVYGMSSWDWNVYTDGYYAYAFPTYTNRLWWNWRYGPIWYNSYWSWYDYYWNYPYYAWHSHYYPHWHHPHHFYPSYVGGRHFTHNAYTNRASRIYRANTSTRPGSSDRLTTSRSTSRRATSVANGRQTVRTSSDGNTRQVRRGTSTSTSTRRVVGTRNSSTSREQGASVRSERTNSTRNRTTVTRSGSNRSDAASSRRNTYTRPSSTRTTEATSGSSSRRNDSSTYTRSSSRSSSNDRSSVRSSSGSSTRSYNSSGSSSRSSSGSFSSGGSSRSSSGGGFSGGGGGGSRSGGGGGSRGSRR